MKASASETMWSGVLKPRVWMSGTSLVGALNHKNTELFKRPSEGMQELAHSTGALHKVLTENAEVWSTAAVEEWRRLCDKRDVDTSVRGVVDGTPLLADVQHVIALANDIRMKWERWSSAFGCLGTAMVALSAVLCGGAVLSDDHGVKCEMVSHRVPLTPQHP